MSSGVNADQALMSAPTQNALSPAAVRIAQRMLVSASICSAYSPSASIMSCVSELSFAGRLSVMVATGPSIASVVSGSDMLLLRELQTHRRIAEQRRLHLFEIGIDPQREIREIQDVALEIDTGRDLAHHQAIFCQIDDTALGDVGDVLAALARHVAAERDVLDGFDELAALTFLRDGELAVA